MYQLVPYVVERQSLRLSCGHKPVVVRLDVGIEPYGRYGGLRQQCAELAVAVALDVGLRVDRCPRLVPERSHAAVGGQLVRLPELGEVACADKHRRGVDDGYPLDGSDVAVVPFHRLVRPDELQYALPALVDGLLYPFHVVRRSPVHEAERPCACLFGGPYLVDSRQLGLLFFDEAVAVEVQLPEFMYLPVLGRVGLHLVDMPHGVFGYGLRVGPVVLSAPQPAAALDLERRLAPYVIALEMQVVAGEQVVAASGLEAEQTFLPDPRCAFPDPYQEVFKACLAVRKHLIASHCGCFVFFSDDGHVKFFLRYVDSDK